MYIVRSKGRNTTTQPEEKDGACPKEKRREDLFVGIMSAIWIVVLVGVCVMMDKMSSI